MNALDLPLTSDPSFSTNGSIQGRTIRVGFSGSADLHAKEPIEALLVKLHAEAIRLAVEQVDVDFMSLEFMNSSCFKSFLSWISRVQELPQEQQYRIHFLSNAEMHWQKRSLHALRCFAVDLITVES